MNEHDQIRHTHCVAASIKSCVYSRILTNRFVEKHLQLVVASIAFRCAVSHKLRTQKHCSQPSLQCSFLFLFYFDSSVLSVLGCFCVRVLDLNKNEKTALCIFTFFTSQTKVLIQEIILISRLKKYSHCESKASIGFRGVLLLFKVTSSKVLIRIHHHLLWSIKDWCLQWTQTFLQNSGDLRFNE